MIKNISTYRCNKCKKFYDFDNSDKYCPICKDCNIGLTHVATYDVDTETKSKPPEMQLEQYLEYINKPPTVTCPYCQSTDTKKISGTSRFMSTGIFGLASKKIGKQWHCNKCTSDF